MRRCSAASCACRSISAARVGRTAPIRYRFRPPRIPSTTGRSAARYRSSGTCRQSRSSHLAPTRRRTACRNLTSIARSSATSAMATCRWRRFGPSYRQVPDLSLQYARAPRARSRCATRSAPRASTPILALPGSTRTTGPRNCASPARASSACAGWADCSTSAARTTTRPRSASMRARRCEPSACRLRRSSSCWWTPPQSFLA